MEQMIRLPNIIELYEVSLQSWDGLWTELDGPASSSEDEHHCFVTISELCQQHNLTQL